MRYPRSLSDLNATNSYCKTASRKHEEKTDRRVLLGRRRHRLSATRVSDIDPLCAWSVSFAVALVGERPGLH